MIIPLTIGAEIGFITSEPKPFSHRIRSRGMRSFRIDRDMEVKGVGYALGAAALFGASTPAAKLLLGNLSPLMLSALLYLGAAIALSAYRFLAVESREAQITRRDLPRSAASFSSAECLGRS